MDLHQQTDAKAFNPSPHQKQHQADEPMSPGLLSSSSPIHLASDGSARDCAVSNNVDVGAQDAHMGSPGAREAGEEPVTHTTPGFNDSLLDFSADVSIDTAQFESELGDHGVLANNSISSVSYTDVILFTCGVFSLA